MSSEAYSDRSASLLTTYSLRLHASAHDNFDAPVARLCLFVGSRNQRLAFAPAHGPKKACLDTALDQHGAVIVRHAADTVGVSSHLNLNRWAFGDFGEKLIEGGPRGRRDFNTIGLEIECKADGFWRLCGESFRESAMGIFSRHGFRFDVAPRIDRGGTVRFVEDCPSTSGADGNRAGRAAFFRQQDDEGIDAGAAGKVVAGSQNVDNDPLQRSHIAPGKEIIRPL